MTTCVVDLTLRFVAEIPDGVEGDDRADAIGDAICRTLERETPIGVYDESIEVVDWTSSPAEVAT